jgi:hypothetical protein
MKPYAIALVVGGLAFAFMSYQLDWIGSPSSDEDQPAAETKPEPVAAKQQKKKLRFPYDLGPAARAMPVPDAALFTPEARTYPLVFLKANGALVQNWQDKLPEGWGAETVEETQLVVVLGPHKKIFVDHTPYPGGAPPIDRYRWELELSVVEPRTGKVLTNRTFANIPRALKHVEAWELTEIGTPIAYKTVFTWVASNARAGFPELSNPHPVVTVVE